jgi:Zn finger protein HypA/HybF involved in hydrogenase expression
MYNIYVLNLKGGGSMKTSDKGFEEGKYECKNCGEVIKLDSFSSSLPKCPKCKSTKYSLINSERA